MQTSSIQQLLQSQRDFFATGKTLSVEFRIEQLKKLRTIIAANEAAILQALKQDLNRSDTESLVAEIYLILKEIDFAIKKLPHWVKPEKKSSFFPLLWPGRSEVLYEPYGSVFIIAPWNYPMQLVFVPLIGAIAAGNCVIVKPSEVATQCDQLIAKIINDNFAKEFLVSIQATPPEMTEILKEKFDYIFFTGGTAVGKIIMAAAAQHLTPVTLELGGKSPCIVDATANLDYAARRVAWGKFVNAGQTCIAPDYLLIEDTIKDVFIKKLEAACQRFYGGDAKQSQSYCRIINQKHFARIQALMKDGKIIFGGETDANEKYIAPTLLDEVSLQASIMQEEIFGPVLPILSFKQIPEAVNIIQSLPKPLALYLFSTDKKTKQLVTERVSFGNGSINDCLYQITNYDMPFGGIGPSGMGYYHGFYSFETFSHKKSIYTRKLTFDPSIMYPPYTKQKLQLIRQFLRI